MWLHQGTKCQHFGYFMNKTLNIVGKLSWQTCKLFGFMISLFFMHIVKF